MLGSVSLAVRLSEMLLRKTSDFSSFWTRYNFTSLNSLKLVPAICFSLVKDIWMKLTCITPGVTFSVFKWPPIQSVDEGIPTRELGGWSNTGRAALDRQSDRLSVAYIPSSGRGHCMPWRDTWGCTWEQSRQRGTLRDRLYSEYPAHTITKAWSCWEKKFQTLSIAAGHVVWKPEELPHLIRGVGLTELWCEIVTGTRSRPNGRCISTYGPAMSWARAGISISVREMENGPQRWFGTVGLHAVLLRHLKLSLLTHIGSAYKLVGMDFSSTKKHALAHFS